MNTTSLLGHPSMLSIITKRLGIFATLLVAAFILAGCGNNEPQQRGAFISFLQTKILDKKGLVFPTMSAEDKNAIGSYATHYQIILDFNDNLSEAVKVMNDVNGLQSKLSSMKGLQEHWQELAPLRTSLPELAQVITSEQQKAQAARDALKQSDDLKAVYDQAFAKTVTKPAETFSNVLPTMGRTLQAMEDFGRFLSDNKANIKISGPVAEIRNPALRAQFQKLQKNYMSEAQALVSVAQEVNNLARGE